ncbi:MAG TPA: hypothetical protein VK914_08605 [bacterium]|nr:hypothetical protein [bacterium]
MSFFAISDLRAIATTNEQQIANSVFGNLSTDTDVPPPPANNFAQPLPIGMGARALGMGEAFTGLSDDISAIWWNPAGLVQTEKNEIQWMGGDHVTDEIDTGFVAADYMLQNHMNFGISYERPYNPVGAYPTVITGTYFGATHYTGTGGPTSVTVGNNGSTGQQIGWFNIGNTAVQAYLAELYREYINPAFQDDTVTLTYATPLSPDNNLSMGINLKYYFQDGDYTANNTLLDKVSGYGVDLGVMYRYPMMEWGREFSVGLDLRDLASQVNFDNGSGSGRQETLPTTATLGLAWQTNEYFTRQELNLTVDYSYVNDPALDTEDDQRFNLGAEMWFFRHRLAARGGYEIYFDQQESRPTLGLGFRTADKPSKDGLGLDYAYMFPAENDKTAMNWFSLSYRWGGITKAPILPDVNVTMDPPIFSPRRGDTATFALQASSPNGIDRWTLSIIDHNNQVVKVYQDRGDPPAQIVWGGEDRQYRLLPDGEYTYLFTATDHDGATSSTPVQTLKIYTPPPEQVEHDEIDKLRGLIAQQDASDEVGDQSVRAATLKDLQTLLAKQATNQDLPPLAKAPVEPQPVTPFAEAKAAAGSFDYPTVNDMPFPKTSVVTGVDGKPVFQVQFNTEDDQTRMILRDMADVARVSAGDVGASVARYDIRADYGSRELRMVAPASSAQDLNRGFITWQQFVNGSSVTLDGSLLSPNYP